MAEYVLSFRPTIGQYGWHDPSAVIFEDGPAVFGVEQERHTRKKHAPETLPIEAIQECLDFCEISLEDVDHLVFPHKPSLQWKIASYIYRWAFSADSIPEKLYWANDRTMDLIISKFFSTVEVERKLRDHFEDPIPPIREYSHHKCHAASAFHPSGFSEALVLTIDARGEYDSTVVWRGDESGLKRIKTFEVPNSLGFFFGAVTEFLGYHANNGEGKVMGLAPYGEHNDRIYEKITGAIETGPDYDVTPLVGGSIDESVGRLEELFEREKRREPSEFTQWEKDLAYTAQEILEEIVVTLTEHHCRKVGTGNVALAGGVALNCKMNKRVMESSLVDEVFMQPVANDAGLALGGGLVGQDPDDVPAMKDVYLGPEFSNDTVEEILETNKLSYREPDDLEATVAGKIADGELIGWFQGRMEMGPRALGNRSILADPRTAESRDRVNKFVKHREEWRPFAPSMTEEGAEEYLVDANSAPFMIKTFDVVPGKADEIEAVIHPADDTTRPQTVRPDQNERYHRLIAEFEEITGVPVVLNTSFNDHAEPIVRTPQEAIKDFFGMGLDTLVINDYILEK